LRFSGLSGRVSRDGLGELPRRERAGRVVGEAELEAAVIPLDD
jgi:hypothetical protein